MKANLISFSFDRNQIKMMNQTRFLLFNITLTLLLGFGSCQNENPRVDIPFRFVNEQIPINSIQYQKLWNPGGHVLLPGAGYKGIIVVNAGGNIYKAYERACTFDPRAECSLIEMDETELFLIDHCCNSSFNLQGIPIGGPASIPLLEYQTIIDGNMLIISNE